MSRYREHAKDYAMAHREAERCELCGCTRTLEVHHIIPISVGGPDVRDNMIVICGKCHSLLTPKSILTKMGIKATKRENELASVRKRIYEECNEILEDGEPLSAEDVFDVLDSVFSEYDEIQ